MLYIIGGPPRCGKSTLAKKLSQKLRVSWVSADSLEGISKFYTPKKIYNQRFPKDFLRKKTGNKNEDLYTLYSAKQILNAYLTQASSVWPAVYLFLDSLAKETPDIDFIMEGYQLPPVEIAKFKKSYPDLVKAVYLVKTHHTSILEGIHAYQDKQDWVKSKSQSPDIYPKIASMLSLYGKHTAKEARKNRLTVVNTENNFNKQVNHALGLLLK